MVSLFERSLACYRVFYFVTVIFYLRMCYESINTYYVDLIIALRFCITYANAVTMVDIILYLDSKIMSKKVYSVFIAFYVANTYNIYF